MWLDQKHYLALGAALLAAREAAGLNQTALARRLRKPQSFVSSYENGQRRIDVLEFISITDELGCDPARVFADVLATYRGRRSRK